MRLAVQLCAFIASLTVLPVMYAHAQTQPSDEFSAWARGALHPLTATDMSGTVTDLAPLGRMIGDARVVAFAEALHGASEPLALRNRLFKYLIQEHGFRAIAIESGIVESEVLNDYVLGGGGELADVMAKGLSWGFDVLPQNAELLRWMRAYNATRASDQKIRIYGFDVPGSPGNNSAVQGPEVALEKILRYLRLVDTQSEAELRRRVGTFLTQLKSEYPKIKQADRDALTVSISDVIALIERNQTEYTARASAKEYEWALRAAIGARQVDSWLRQFPVGYTRSDGPEPQLLATRLRDRAMADNLDWILQELGPEGRLFVFGALSHLSTAPITYVEATVDLTSGIHFKRRHRDELVTVGTLLGGGVIGNCKPIPRIPLTDAPASSVNGVLSQLGVPLFVLDLRDAPPGVASWLSDVREVWSGFNIQKVRLAEAMDAAVFVKLFSPACN